MASLTLRSVIGRTLTNNELDANFTSLNADIATRLLASSNLSDLVDAAAARSNLGLGSVENKSSATIRGELSSLNVTTALGFTPYSAANPSGFISGISSSMVTTALGFTPYNSTNPSGFISGITGAMVAAALGFTPYSNANPTGYITSAALSPYLTSATAASTYQAALTSGTNIKTVNGQSVLGAGNIQIDGGVTSFNTRTGAVTLSSSDVTTALGYTPFNAGGNTILNSSNYSSYAVAASGGAVKTAQGTYGLQTYPTADGSLAVGGWARSHNFSAGSSALNFAHFGALGEGDSISYAYISTGTDATDYSSTNALRVYPTFAAWGTNTLLHAGNYSSYALPLSGGTVTGTVTLTGGRIYATSAASVLTYGAPIHIRDNEANGSNSSYASVAFSSAPGADFSIGKYTNVGAGYLQIRNHNNTQLWTMDYAGNITQSGTISATGSISTASAMYVTGQTVLHAANYSSYALPLSGGNLSGDLQLVGNYLRFDQSGTRSWNVRAIGGNLDVNSGDGSGSLRYNGYALLHAGNYTSYLGDYGVGSYRVIADYDSANTWYIRSNGRFTWARAHDWTQAFELYLGDGTAASNNGWAEFGQRTSNNAAGTWFGTHFVQYAGGVTQDASIRAGRYYLGDNTNYVLNAGDGSLRLQTANGYVDIGPKNSSWCHIYSDRDFYTNRGIWINGNQVLHAGNYSSYALPLSGGTVTGRTTFSDGLRIGPTPGDPNAYIITRTIPAGDPNVGNEATELLLFHANDNANGSGPDYITLRAPAIRLQTYDNAAVSDPDASAGWNNRITISPAGVVNVPGTLQQGGSQVLHAGNYSSYALPLSGGTVSGTIGSARNDVQRLFESYNTSAGSPTQFYIDHSYGDVNIGNARGAIKIQGSVALHAGNYASYTNASYLPRQTANTSFYVGGSSSTYYPVLFTSSSSYTDEWNAATYFELHRDNVHENFSAAGSFRLRVYAQYSSWGHRPNQVMRVEYTPGFGTYGDAVGDVTAGDYREGNVVVWLRGGMTYHLKSLDWAYTYVSVGNPSGTSITTSYATYNSISSQSTTIVNAKNGLALYGNAVLTSSNYTSYAINRGGDTVDGVFYFRSNKGSGSYVGGQNTYGLEAFSGDGGAAGMSFHRGGYYAVNMGLDPDNVIRIGGWSAPANLFQMDMAGNLTMANNVTAYSDERLKTDWLELPADYVERLAEVKSGTYTRVDNQSRQAGSSAQAWLALLPEVVQVGGDEAKTLSLAYGNAALVSAVELAKKAVAQEARIKRLEELVSRLLEA